MENFANDIQTTLASGIDGAVTAVTVASGAGFPSVNFRVRVEDEIMLVTSKGAGTNWTVTRGVEGTTAVAHAGGIGVTHVITEGGLAQYLADRYQPFSAYPVMKKEIPDAESFEILDGYQMLVGGGFTVSGTLTVSGELHVVS